MTTTEAIRLAVREATATLDQSQSAAGMSAMRGTTFTTASGFLAIAPSVAARRSSIA